MARWNRIIGSSEEVDNAFSDALTLFSILIMLLALCFLVECWYTILFATLYVLIIISNVASWFDTRHAGEIIELTRRMHRGLENSRMLSNEYQDVIDEQARVIEEMRSADSGSKDIQEDIDVPTIRKIRA